MAARSAQAAIINDLAERYPMITVAQTIDKLKDAGFYWATRSGVTIAMADVLVPPNKKEILERYEARGPGIEHKFTAARSSTDASATTRWSSSGQDATDEVGKAVEELTRTTTRSR